MSEETVSIAKKRRLAKAEGDHDRVKQLNASCQREARRDKEKFYNEKCNMIEQSNSNGNTRDLFKTIRDITGTFTPRIGIVKNKQGKDLSEEVEVKARWKECTEDLHRRDATISEEFLARDFTREPSISESEVIRAMKEVVNGKAPGIDNIPIDLFKGGRYEVQAMIKKICNRMLDTAKRPRQWKQSIYIPIPKKDPRACENNRTISLIVHASKTFLKVMQKHLEQYLEQVDSGKPGEQSGFRKNRVQISR